MIQNEWDFIWENLSYESQSNFIKLSEIDWLGFLSKERAEEKQNKI